MLATISLQRRRLLGQSFQSLSDLAEPQSQTRAEGIQEDALFWAP